MLQLNDVARPISILDAYYAYDEGFSLGPISANLQSRRIGLLGPNGSGKTTLLRALAGILPKSAGGLSVSGRSAWSEDERRCHVAYGAAASHWHAGVTALDYIRFVKRLYPSWSGEIERTLMERFGLSHGSVIATASAGMQAKFSLVLALSRRCDVVLLDEPWNALDPVSRVELTTEMIALTSDYNTPVIVSSHELQQIEDFCDEFLLLVRGKLVAAGSREQLLSSSASGSSRSLLDLYIEVTKA